MGKINLITIIFTFCILISLVASQNSDIKNRTLNYNLGQKIYSIEEKMNHISVTIKKNIDCLVEPCDYPVTDVIEIDKEKDSQNLKLVLDEIFNKTKITEKSVTDGDLSDQQIAKIFTVFESNNITSRLKYVIVKDNNDYTPSKRGYIYQNMKWHYYTIYAGQMPSSGYSIDIAKVDIRGYSVIVYIRETSGIGGKLAVLTYPRIKIKFNYKPANITFINMINKQEYPKLH